MSLYRDSAADSSTVDVRDDLVDVRDGLGVLGRTAASTVGSSATVLVFSMVGDFLLSTPHRPRPRVSVKSIRVSRWPHLRRLGEQHLRAGLRRW